MTEREITSIDGGSSEYWRERRFAFLLIRLAERSLQKVQWAPLYIQVGIDAQGRPIEILNMAPFDDLDEAVREIEANPTAVGILVAQGRTHIGWHPVGAVIRRLAGD